MPRSIIHAQERTEGRQKVRGKIRDRRVELDGECGRENSANILGVEVKKENRIKQRLRAYIIQPLSPRPECKVSEPLGGL